MLLIDTHTICNAVTLYFSKVELVLVESNDTLDIHD